ncbi:MAG: DUF4342 domain-containing protein [Chloroflexi bacterium]|nr:DUF4342 domain-containing protein [Chloroflexota bacterium]
MTNNNNPESTPSARSWTEEIEVAANQVVEQVQNLVREGNVRRLIIKHEGNTVLEVPVTIAAIAGVAALYMAPLLAALGALAGLVARVQVVVEREGDKPETVDINPSDTPSLSLDPTLTTVSENEAETGGVTQRLD